MKPGLTLLCITKDQAPKLLRLLQSVQGVVDDIVVVDTGSSDLSPGVARMQGGRVFQIDWPGSFSEALNAGMREIETDWTIRLDTDEWLLPESGPQIRELLRHDEAFGYYLIRQDLSDEEHYSEGYMLRMWRSDPRLRFQGFIHEHFPAALLERVTGGRKLFQTPVRFRHDGFVGGSSEAKHRRNLELLRKELAARPGQSYYEVELAMTLLLLKDAEGERQVEALADRFMAEADVARPEPYVANLLGCALMAVKRRQLSSERTERLIAASWKSFPSSPPLLWAIAQTELRRQNLEGLYRALLRLEEMAVTGDYEREWTFDGRILSDHLWETLARAAAAVGDVETEIRCRDRLAQKSPGPRAGASHRVTGG